MTPSPVLPQPAVATASFPARETPPQSHGTVPSTTASQGPSQHCSQPGCRSKRVHALCARYMCRKHCVSAGGCPVNGHSLKDLPDKQRATLQAMATQQHPPLPATIPAVRAQLEALDDRSMESIHAIERDYIHTFQPPIIDPVLERIDNELLAMRSPTSAQLRAMWSPTPPPDDPIPPPNSLPPPSQAEPSGSQMQPRIPPPVSVPAASQRAQPPSSQMQPRITRQLSEAWMVEITDRRAKNRDARDRRTLIDRSATHRFMLVFWDCEDTGPVVHCIQETPDWPRWRLSDHPDVVRSLGSDLTEVDVYSQKAHIWMQVALNFTHTLTPDCYVLMRRRHTICKDEHKHIQAFVTPQDAPRHLRYDLTAERKLLRSEYRSLNEQPDDDDDDEVQIVTASSPIKRRTRAPRNIRSQRPRLSITIPTLSHSSTPSSSTPSSSMPSSSSTRLASTSSSATSISSDMLSRSSSPVAPESPGSQRVWPSAWHVVDIINGFVEMDNPENSHLPVNQRFEKIFRCRFKRSTYGDQRTRWDIATPEQRNAAIDAGYTADGLWAKFAKEIPLKGR
jgi:hypothetical protein